MSNVIKVTSLAAIIALGSACSETDTVLSKPSTKTEKTVYVESAETDNKAIKVEIKAGQSEKNELPARRLAESHTHGKASLAVVLEGVKITVKLDTPLYNMVGFEYVAETEAQKAAVIKAESVLSEGASLFVFNDSAGCTAPGTKESVELGIEHGHADHNVHDDHTEDDHKDDHHNEDEHDDAHKDVSLQYEYMCSSPKALKNITVKLFGHFENLSELDLVYLGPNTQKQGVLSAAKPRMDLTK